MGKTRMTILDVRKSSSALPLLFHRPCSVHLTHTFTIFATQVRAGIANLRNQLLGARCANVYDLDPKTYLIKTAKGGEKVLLLLESGVRFHSTNYSRDKSNTPSGFCLKLRKHIRTKKVEEVRQLGVDRVVVFTFGAGADANHLVLELFAGGNIILTDHECNILALLRTYTDETTGQKIAVRELYSMTDSKQNRKISKDLLLTTIQNATQSAHEKTILKDILIKDLDYGPALVDHALLGAKVPGKCRLLDFNASEDSPEMSSLLKEFAEVDDLIEKLGADGKMVPGYVIRRDSKEDSPYDDFAPLKLRQFEGRATVDFESLDKAMDAYFAVAEDQKIEAQKIQQQKAAISKVERVKRGHEASIKALQEEEAAQYSENCAPATLIKAILMTPIMARAEYVTLAHSGKPASCTDQAAHVALAMWHVMQHMDLPFLA
jgi:predicted ribosome quality control (RQC) complex YloA/Tae2 family protein